MAGLGDNSPFRIAGENCRREIMSPSNARTEAGHAPVVVHMPKIVGMAITLTLFASGFLLAQTSDDARQALKGNAAFGDWREDKPGVKRLITPHDLPPISAPNY